MLIHIIMEVSVVEITYRVSYDGSSVDIEIEFNKNFNSEIAFIDIINNIKSMQLLWEIN